MSCVLVVDGTAGPDVEAAPPRRAPGIIIMAWTGKKRGEEID
jgi:hypothetical protein